MEGLVAHSWVHGYCRLLNAILLLPDPGSRTWVQRRGCAVYGCAYLWSVSLSLGRASIHYTDYRIAVAFVAVVITGYFGDKFPQQRGLIISGWLTCSLTCAVIICAVYNLKARYGLLIIMAAGLWATNACALSYAASTFSDMPRETRGVALALVNALGNLAQIYGYVLRPQCISEWRTDFLHSAYLFPEEDRPKYLLGFGVIAGMCAFGVMVYALAHVLFRRHIR